MHPFSPEELIEQVSPVGSFNLSLSGLNSVGCQFFLKSSLDQHGKTVIHAVFEDEGHGFQKKANQISADRDMLGFFLKHCGKAGCSDAQD